jgi:hypothetical protein
VYCCGGERNLYCSGGAERSMGGDGEEEKDGDAAAALPHAVAHVGAPSVYSCGGAEERKVYNGDAAPTFAHAVAPVELPNAAAAGLYGEWRGGSESCCCAEQRRFRKDKVTRRNSVARRAVSATGISQRNRDRRWRRLRLQTWFIEICFSVDAGAGSNWVKAHYSKARQ